MDILYIYDTNILLVALDDLPKDIADHCGPNAIGKGIDAFEAGRTLLLPR